jgi:hypothetical protein
MEPSSGRMSAEEAQRLSRRAFVYSMGLPAAYVGLPFFSRVIPGFSQIFWVTVSLVVALGGAIGAIRVGNRVRRAPGVDDGLAIAAVVIGWIEIVLSTIGVLVVAALVYLFAHADFTM